MQAGAWGCLHKEPMDSLSPGLRLPSLARGSQKDPYLSLITERVKPHPFQVH